MDARYNLRSTKRECNIPVQLQLAKDDDFLALASSSGTGQVFDSEHSADIDISVLLKHSNKKLPSL